MAGQTDVEALAAALATLEVYNDDDAAATTAYFDATDHAIAIIAALAAQGWRITSAPEPETPLRTVPQVEAYADARIRAALEGLRAEVAVLPEASFGAIWRGAALDAIDKRLNDDA